MKMIFKTDLSDDLEKTLAGARYARCWQQNSQAITDSFYKHTGLRFKQKQITVRIRADGRSRSGNARWPMELSVAWVTPEEVGKTLIHELAHRLVIGNGIEPPDNSKYNYFVHRHIYLFLYDVYIDIFGKEAADREVARESTGKNEYITAWKWALSFDYSQRQEAFKRLKRRYRVAY